MRKVMILLLAAALVGCGRGEKKTTTTPSGLKITDIVVGEGPTPKKMDLVTIHYTAWVLDGDKIDSSVDRDTPFTFRMGFEKVLPGWEEGISTMKAGGKRMLIVPPELAFGEQGRPGVVPANATIKVEIELLDVEEGPPLPKPWDVSDLPVKTTPTGLGYIDVVHGEGYSPQLGSNIAVHYSGYLENGTLFDSSYIDGRPVVLKLERGYLIEGWVEGLQTMQVGGSRRLIVPPELAYGPKGFGETIPANATLIFDIELLESR